MEIEKKQQYKGNLLLILAAAIWGFAFVAQKQGGNIGTFTFTALRMFIGAAALTPVIHWMDRKKTPASAPEEDPKQDKKLLLRAGMSSGLFMFLGTALQQAGLRYITAGKSGFITATYTLLVPMVSVLLGKKVRGIVWFCAFLCVGGLYLLCMNGNSGFSFGIGEILTLGSSFAFVGQILCIDHFSSKVDGIRMSRLQCITSGILGLILMLLFEHPSLHTILGAWVSLLYVGVCSSAGGYTLQIVGQKYTKPTEATIIMSLESVFSVLAGALLMHDRMISMQYLGCAMIFTATLLPNLPSPRAGKNA
ncbi:MAG: DMT family transporter [Eubacteriales bacterium]|nr:DMT family transporter [Eubacteriales bacterium]